MKASALLGFPKSARDIAAAAVLVAISAVLAYFRKYLTITPTLRITFENLPIILSGMLFGPVTGFATGVAADILSTLVSFYGLANMNPIITAGAGAVGLVSGIMAVVFRNKPLTLRLVFSVSAAHIVGNMIVKSVGLHVYYGTPYEVLAVRIPLYIAIAAVEYFLLFAILKNNGVRKALRLPEERSK